MLNYICIHFWSEFRCFAKCVLLLDHFNLSIFFELVAMSLSHLILIYSRNLYDQVGKLLSLLFFDKVSHKVVLVDLLLLAEEFNQHDKDWSPSVQKV